MTPPERPEWMNKRYKDEPDYSPGEDNEGVKTDVSSSSSSSSSSDEDKDED